MKKTTLCITDDYEIVHKGIASYLIGNEEFELIGGSLSGKELFENLKRKQPDILLLDIKLPGLSGIQIAKVLRKDYPKIKIMFISSNLDQESLDDAIKAGGLGYLSKDVSEEEFLFALTKIKAGESYYSIGIQPTLFQSFTNNAKAKTDNNDGLLTSREIDVLKLIVEGLSLKQVGEQLFISKRTVETHKKNILEKLELKTTVDLVKYAILNGVISI